MSNETIEPTCPPTYHLDKSICKCVKDTVEPGPIPPIQCPPLQHWDASLQKCIPDLEPPITPPPVEPPIEPIEKQYDEHGTLLIHKVPDMTKRVVMDDPDPGDIHRNGKRYNVNHRFLNNMMLGYFKTGKGQEKLEQKLDGPNHGGCTSMPNCMWYEPSIIVDSGKIELGGEWPHPVNHGGLRMDFHQDIDGGIKEQWLGYCVCCYTNKEGQRVVEQWSAKNPFDAAGKPTNNWIMNLRSTETGDGKMFPAKYVPRDMQKVMDHENGFEAEIRMHKATSGDTEMKWTYVWEIEPPGADSPVIPPVTPPPVVVEPPIVNPPVEPPIVEPPIAPAGDVLWDSNIHLKTGQAFTVTDTHGPQTPDSKGLWMAASGNPRLIVDPDGTYHLEADKGHGRVYIRATNFNCRLESDFMFEDSNIDNSTWRLRCRHNEGGDCSNRFGGIGYTIERPGVGHKTESCHNLHENSIDKPLSTAIKDKQWIRVRCDCKNSPDNKKILLSMQIDYKDGKGFQTVLEGEHPSPQAYYMDEPTFMKESYIWLRINNTKTGRVAFKNTLLTKL